MASISRKTCPACHGDMSVRDTHSICLQCLTATHVPTKCSYCQDIPFNILKVRYGLMGDALQQSKWPSDWRVTLARIEQVVWSAPEHNSPTASEDDEEETDPKQIDPRKKGHSVSQGQNQSGSLPASAWKTGVENSITGLSDSLRLINESLNSLVNTKVKKRKAKPKTQVSKKAKTGKRLEPELVQVRAKVGPSSNTQSSAQDESLSLGSILNRGVTDSAGSMRPPPAASIPRVS